MIQELQLKQEDYEELLVNYLRQLFLDCTASSIALPSCIYKRSGKNAGRFFLRAGKGLRLLHKRLSV